MRKRKGVLSLLLAVALVLALGLASARTANAAGELSLPQAQAGLPPVTFVPAAGQWSEGQDAGNAVLIVGGAAGARVEYPYVVAGLPADFREGVISLRFKGVSGKEDQAAGILFNLGRTGDYYALRANCLEDNLILWVVKGGRRSEVKGVTVPTPAAGRWHELKLVVQGHRVTGFLDGRQHLVHDLPAPVSGKVGIWSKSDSHMLFSGFSVTTR